MVVCARTLLSDLSPGLANGAWTPLPCTGSGPASLPAALPPDCSARTPTQALHRPLADLRGQLSAVTQHLSPHGRSHGRQRVKRVAEVAVHLTGELGVQVAERVVPLGEALLRVEVRRSLQIGPVDR